MSSTIVVPQGFSYVAASLLSIAVLLQWQAGSINYYRKEANIPYPQTFAEKAEMQASKEALIFNCAQRAHYNTVENVPIIVICTLVTALRHPIYAASACGLFTVGRILYTIGYLSGEPRNRHARGGWLGIVAIAAMFLGTIYTTGSMILEGI